MFQLWIGVMGGVAAAYLLASQWSAERWRLPQWWIGISIATIVLVWAGWEFLNTASFGLGLRDAMKSVLLPWMAGFGFGVWMSLTTMPITRGQSAASWIPILVALLFVTLIVSDERYNWLGRLQKITLGGGGVEFTSLSGSAPLPVDRSPIGVSGGQQGEGRIGNLLAIMAGLADFIDRDNTYATDVGFPVPSEIFERDKKFAGLVIAPLGKRLKTIHQVRGYNSIDWVIGRPFVESFRALTQGYAPSHEPRQQIVDIGNNIKAIWQVACDTEFRLRSANFMEPDPERNPSKHLEDCTKEQARASQFIDGAAKGSPPQGFFASTLPYGTLLSSMLMNAAGEIETAAADLDRWATRNEPNLTAADDQYKWFGIYRARFYAASLLQREGPAGVRSYFMITQNRKVIDLGQRLLNSKGGTVRGKWRDQVETLKGSRTDAIWHTAECGNDLSASFKRLMMANLSVQNNYVYFLSQDLPFAKSQGLEEEMENYGKFLATVSVRCLQADPLSEDARIDADSTRASFLDTAANVELVLAAQEEEWSKKRTRLCLALHHVEKAVALYREFRSARDRRSQAPASQREPWEVLQSTNALKEDLDTVQTGLILLRRHERAKADLRRLGMDC
jgi:hypothetical protein